MIQARTRLAPASSSLRSAPRRRLRPRAATIAVAAVATVGLSACGTGLDAQTNAVYQASIGADQREGNFQLYNAIVVDNGDDSWSLTVGILNTTDSQGRLEGYTIAPLDGGGAITGRPGSPVTVPPSDLTTIGYDGEVIFDSPDLLVGRYALVSLNFSDGSTTEVETPIFPRTSDLNEVEGGTATPTTPDESALKDASLAGEGADHSS